MPKRVIDFYDSVDFTGDWEFVKQKKAKIVVLTQKTVNSQIYMTFNEVIPLYTFLYFALAPEEAFAFQKVQPIFEKMKGDNSESQQQFEECKRALSLGWDGVTPLSELIRQHKKHIIREQKSIYNISSRIDEEEIKQLIKSGLSQRKIHLDFHTNDGQEQQAIIPSVENINNYISVIYEERKHKYLLAFFCHIEEQDKKAEQKGLGQRNLNMDREIHNRAQTFKERTLPTKSIPNPDDRPLPPPPKQHHHHHEGHHNSFSNQRQPSFERNILDPDDKFLSPPGQDRAYGGAPRTSPKNIFNPDDRLLIPPPKQDPKEKKLAHLSSSKIAGKQTPNKNGSKVGQLKKEVKHLGEVAGEKIHELGQKAMHLAEKVEDKMEQMVDDFRHENHNWIQLGVGVAIIGMAIKTLRG